MARSCPHGVVAGVCVFCLSDETAAEVRYLADLTTAIRDRTRDDGRPYYCLKCGAGFTDFMACELSRCVLESEAEAAARQRRLRDNA